MKNIDQILTKTIARENKLQRLSFKKDDNLKVSFENNNFSFESNHGNGFKKLDLPIKHQLGSRIFGNGDRQSVVQRFDDELKANRRDFESLVAEKLKETDSILLLDNSQSSVYGLVSSNFEFMDPREIRSEFLDKYKIYGIPSDSKKKVGYTKFGEPYEKFQFNQKLDNVEVGEEIGYAVVLIYGLNNGYSSYRVSFGREVLICSNGMTTIEDRRFARLKHLKNPDIKGFVNEIYGSLKSYNEALQKQILRAKDSKITRDIEREFYRRLHVSRAVKERVFARFKKEQDLTGYSEWSLSQSLTNIGTHYYGASNDLYHENILVTVGSDIVDSSLKSILNSPVKKESYGSFKSYTTLLPKDFRLN